MKIRTKSILIPLAVVLVSSTVYAVGSTPGGIDDPIVTKSYVDQKVNEINARLDNIQNNTYQIVTVSQGKQLIGSQGTEIIVRDGVATVNGGAGGGLQDMTQGVDLNNGVSVPKYHLLIVPRDDGRGITASTDLTLMVRGDYTIK